MNIIKQILNEEFNTKLDSAITDYINLMEPTWDKSKHDTFEGNTSEITDLYYGLRNELGLSIPDAVDACLRRFHNILEWPGAEQIFLDGLFYYVFSELKSSNLNLIIRDEIIEIKDSNRFSISFEIGTIDEEYHLELRLGKFVNPHRLTTFEFKSLEIPVELNTIEAIKSWSNVVVTEIKRMIESAKTLKEPLKEEVNNKLDSAVKDYIEYVLKDVDKYHIARDLFWGLVKHFGFPPPKAFEILLNHYPNALTGYNRLSIIKTMVIYYLKSKLNLEINTNTSRSEILLNPEYTITFWLLNSQSVKSGLVSQKLELYLYKLPPLPSYTLIQKARKYISLPKTINSLEAIESWVDNTVIKEINKLIKLTEEGKPMKEEYNQKSYFEKLLDIIKPADYVLPWAKEKYETEINNNPNADLILDILDLRRQVYPETKINFKNVDIYINISRPRLEIVKTVWENELNKELETKVK